MLFGLKRWPMFIGKVNLKEFSKQIRVQEMFRKQWPMFIGRVNLKEFIKKIRVQEMYQKSLINLIAPIHPMSSQISQKEISLFFWPF